MRCILLPFAAISLVALACGGSDDTAEPEGASGSPSAGASGANASGMGGSVSGKGGSASGSAGSTAGSTSGSSGSSGSTAGSSGGAGFAGGAGAGSVGGNAGASGSTAGTSSGSAGAGGSSGSAGSAGSTKCKTTAECAKTDYCDFSDELCGTSPYIGHCKPRPVACSDLYAPACGCDGKTYSNSCDATAAGVDLSNQGGCAAPNDSLFACGARFCAKADQYCQKTNTDVASIPDDYFCMPIPPVCGNAPDCDCLEKTPCGGFACMGDFKTGMQTTCPGG